jgi:hypothetical protein
MSMDFLYLYPVSEVNSTEKTKAEFQNLNFLIFYPILIKLGHLIPLWKGKNPIYFGVFTIIPFDNLYRRAYFVMHTFLEYAELTLS